MPVHNSEPPRDTPANRRYLARHPEAAGLDAQGLVDHAFHEACRGLDNLQRRLDRHRKAQPDSNP